MIAPLPGCPENAAELALQAVDGGAQASGIHEIVVGLAIEIGDRTLECPEFDRHAGIIRTFVWNVQTRAVNLYSRLAALGRPASLHTSLIVLYPIRSMSMRRDLGLPAQISACLFD